MTIMTWLSDSKGIIKEASPSDEVSWKRRTAQRRRQISADTIRRVAREQGPYSSVIMRKWITQWDTRRSK